MLVAHIAVLALLIAANARKAMASSEKSAPYPQTPLKQMARLARTPEQYNALAGCYRELHEKYLQLAAEEKLEWQRRSQNGMSTAAKYPRPADSARSLYEYDLYKTSKAGVRSALYAQIAAREEAAKSAPTTPE
jgi:hypothetical protein